MYACMYICIYVFSDATQIIVSGRCLAFEGTVRVRIVPLEAQLPLQ